MLRKTTPLYLLEQVAEYWFVVQPNVLLGVIVHWRRARSDVTRQPLPDYLRFERYLADCWSQLRSESMC
jgi:hypothetical protein